MSQVDTPDQDETEAGKLKETSIKGLLQANEEKNSPLQFLSKGVSKPTQLSRSICGFTRENGRICAQFANGHSHTRAP